MRKTLLPAIFFLALTSCSWASEKIENLLPTCDNKVLSLTAAITASGTAAHQYTGLPLCGSPKALPGKFCSDIMIVRTIQSAEQTAHIAIKSAQKVCDDTAFGAAGTAVDAYGDIVKLYQLK